MLDSYQLPAIVLTALLLPAFAQLYLRSRDARTLLWFLGFLFAFLRMVEFYGIGQREFSDWNGHRWLAAAGFTFMQISSALFLASLSPLSFRMGRIRVFYVIPFTVPLTIYAVLLFGVYHGVMPNTLAFLIFPALGGLSLLMGCFWALSKSSMPIWLGLALCVGLGGAGLWICVSLRGVWPLVFVESSLHFLTALARLLCFPTIFGRNLPQWAGIHCVVFRHCGAHPLRHSSSGASSLGASPRHHGLGRGGHRNDPARLGRRTRPQADCGGSRTAARKELEAYSRVVLSRRRVEDFDRQANLICQTVVANSRFAQAALILVQPSGQFRLAGTAGFDDAPLNALEALATRIPVSRFSGARIVPACRRA